MKIARFIIITLLFLMNHTVVICEPIKLGVIIPLSGFVADYGVAVRNGIELARSEVDENVRDRIVINYEDSRYDAKATLSAYNKLVKTDHVDMIHSWGTGASVVLAPLADRDQVPMITLSGDPTVAGNRRYVLDFYNRLEDLGKSTLEYLRSKGYRKYGMVKTEIQYLESLLAGFKAHLGPGESLEIIDSFLPDANPNLSTTVTKIKHGLAKKQYDAIGVYLSTGQLSTFYQKMEQFNVHADTFGADFFDQADEMKKAGKNAKGAIFASLNTSPEFLEKYRAKFKTDFQISYAANSYDMTHLLYDIVSKRDYSNNASEILEVISQIRPTKGVLGEYHFVNEDPKEFKFPGKRVVYPVVIKEIADDGRAVLVQGGIN